ncbi:uncharacterized protein PV07_05154 [Cladophialophora immunda]|uniref:Uncharacterized protein n=2 Tax=Cladophialophora immunda TaxID=569365 RepID=A0A0D2D0L4_9EURO|nr:uncharacterized protein PV07_05154 [Cladophialophora immunda]KIW29334.1 hypothetical protein PV07_05154 [Cladophialophora immunda]
MGETTRSWAPRPSTGDKRAAIDDIDPDSTTSKKRRSQPDQYRDVAETLFDLNHLNWDSWNEISDSAGEGSQVHTAALLHLDTSTWTLPNTPAIFDDIDPGFLEQEDPSTSEALSICPSLDATPGSCLKTTFPVTGEALLESTQLEESIPKPYSTCLGNDDNHSSSPGSSVDLEKPRYDVCFGVIVEDIISSFVPEQKNCTMPVHLKQYGNIFKLYLEDSNKYVGLLELPCLRDFLQELAIEIRPNLEVHSVGAGTNKTVKSRKAKSYVVNRQYSVRITVYGYRSEKDEIGHFLSVGRTYLQHPRIGECEPGTEYCNPHYLVRPGARLPPLEELTISPESPVSKGPEMLNETDKSKIMRVFDTAADFSVPEELVPSPRLRTTLKNHQLVALSTMVWKESGIVKNAPIPSIWELVAKPDKPALYRHIITGQSQDSPAAVLGGCLADEMGLGKTLSVLALICSSLDKHNDRKVQMQRVPRATLIVTPKSTIPGWLQQIDMHVHPGQLRFAVFHGSGRQRLSSMLEELDVILTTYETLRSDWSVQGPLYSTKWTRVVLDEAHHIRNRSSLIYKAACAIHAERRWCLTGTPIQNSLDDFGALLSFIRVPPFGDKSKFDFWITKPLSDRKGNLKRLQDLIRATCIRRTKKMLGESCELPQRIERISEVQLHQHDQQLYNFFKDRCAKIAKGGTRMESESPKEKLCKEDNVLSLINFLRLICDHGAALLPRSALQAWEAGDNRSVDWSMLRSTRKMCYICNSDIEVVDGGTFDFFEATCGHSMCANCALENEDGEDSISSRCPKCALTSSHGDHLSYSVPTQASVRPSAKVEALLKNLRAEQNYEVLEMSSRPTKSVVFSFWTKMLDMIQQALRDAGFGFTRIDGKSSLEDRSRSISRFNKDPTCTVLLASIGAVAEGVDLTAASYVHLVEPHWNPMVEAQAVDRVHRIGQDRNVVITRYIVPKSVETYIQWVQKEKLKIIDQSIDFENQSQIAIEAHRWEELISSFSA